MSTTANGLTDATASTAANAAMAVPAQRARVVVLAIPDNALRQRLSASLIGMRWQVREAAGGAEAMVEIEEQAPEAVLMDNWLPDLEAGAFASQLRALFPAMDVLRIDGQPVEGSGRSPRRNELLHAMREAQEPTGTDEVAWAAAPVAVPQRNLRRAAVADVVAENTATATEEISLKTLDLNIATPTKSSSTSLIQGMIGASPQMLELTELIRLVAPRSTGVLIEGETGTGKEVVAKALHRLSSRSGNSFTVLNCAAIPEALLEAELFGHTRGAFTGAVTSRTGRIEAAHGGTLFLDEIGEMPLPLQAKMLRFLECGELQRVGDNETMRVDVRVIAATHQQLEKRSSEGTFRLDLYHRLAIFPLEVPPLRERLADLPLLVEHFLDAMGREEPRKRLLPAALEKLEQYAWPGNVRELAHVLERASILAGEKAEIGVEEIRFRAVGKG